MNIHKIYIYLFILFAPLNFLVSNVYAQGGLMFKANDHVINERTSYRVFKDEHPEFSGHLYINFKLSLWDTQNLGYIFTLTTGTSSYSFNYIYSYSQPSLNFNIDGKTNKLRYLLDSARLKNRNWLNLKFDFQLKEDLLTINIEGQQFRLNNLGLTDNIKPTLIFGKNTYYSDVPHMSIADLTIGDTHKTYSFPLNEWSGNEVHTSKGEAVGYVQNPIWLIDSFYYWKPVYNQAYDRVVGLNFDSSNHRLLIYGQDSILFFNCSNSEISIHSYRNPMPVRMILGKSIFNYKRNKLYIYEAKKHVKDSDGTSIASLDMSNLKWESIGKAQLTERMHHHSIFYDKNSDSICLFGGYGGYKYYNKIFTYNQKSDKWLEVSFTGDTIAPRFLSAVGGTANPDEIFLFGGYGNASGNQVVGGHPYYDLYRINLQKHTIKRCWSIHTEDNFVPTNNLILSSDHKHIYALCYPHGITKTSLRLYMFSIDDGSYEILGSPIPLTAERIETDVNLFLSETTNELICAIQEFSDPQRSDIRIYSIAYPPIAKNYIENNADRISEKIINTKHILWITAGIALLGCIAFFYIRHTTKKGKSSKTPPLSDNGPVPAEPVITDKKDRFTSLKNAVYLLGEFAVFDKKGMDITHLFSPKIKQLFILILLNNFEHSGINSKKISTTLWPDTEPAKTKNIKGVTLNHLRKILNNIHGIQLIFSEDNYFFEISDDFFCDYNFVMNTIKEVPSQPMGEKKDSRYFNLICRGTLLKDMHEEWLDRFKNKYEKQVTEALSINLASLYKDKNYAEVILTSKTILDIDPFNEEAFRYLLSSIRKTKGIEQCRSLYNQFVANYEKSIGDLYATPLEEILFS